MVGNQPGVVVLVNAVDGEAEGRPRRVVVGAHKVIEHRLDMTIVVAEAVSSEVRSMAVGV